MSKEATAVSLEELRTNTTDQRIVDVPAQISPRHLPNAVRSITVSARMLGINTHTGR